MGVSPVLRNPFGVLAVVTMVDRGPIKVRLFSAPVQVSLWVNLPSNKLPPMLTLVIDRVISISPAQMTVHAWKAMKLTPKFAQVA